MNRPNAKALNMELRDMNQVLRWGIAAILGPMMLIFSVHWWGKAVASEKAGLATYKANVMAQIAEQQATQARTCALEIRGVGLAVDGWQQSTIWRLVQKKNSNFSSIYSRNPNDYQASVTTRWNIQKINIRAAFKYSASESVAYWPIPVFALGPPDPYEKGYRAAGLINSGRNKATLGVTQFLWQDDESTTHAQGMIERLFQFFDDNPQVPQALIASRDGDVTRDVYRKPGTPGLQSGHVVPTIYESMTGLLVMVSTRASSTRVTTSDDAWAIPGSAARWWKSTWPPSPATSTVEPVPWFTPVQTAA
jgi:hypothetical protein